MISKEFIYIKVQKVAPTNKQDLCPSQTCNFFFKFSYIPPLLMPPVWNILLNSIENLWRALKVSVAQKKWFYW